MTPPCPNTVYTFGGLCYDWGRKLLLGADGKLIKLTTSEMRLLGCLASTWPEVARREDLFLYVFRRPWQPEERNIDQMLHKIRRELPRDEHGRSLIEADRGAGYFLTAVVQTHKRVALSNE